MEKKKSLYAIYKYDFHRAINRSIIAESNNADGSKNLKIAQACFASLFDENIIENLAKKNKKGEYTRLPNDVMAKSGQLMAMLVLCSSSLCIKKRPGVLHCSNGKCARISWVQNYIFFS